MKNQAKCCSCEKGPYRPTSSFRGCFLLHLRWTRIVLWMTKIIVFSFPLLTHRLDMVDMADGCGYLLVHACFCPKLVNRCKFRKIMKNMKNMMKSQVACVSFAWCINVVWGRFTRYIYVSTKFDFLPTCIVLFSWWTPLLNAQTWSICLINLISHGQFELLLSTCLWCYDTN